MSAAIKQPVPVTAQLPRLVRQEGAGSPAIAEIADGLPEETTGPIQTVVCANTTVSDPVILCAGAAVRTGAPKLNETAWAQKGVVGDKDLADLKSGRLLIKSLPEIIGFGG